MASLTPAELLDWLARTQLLSPDQASAVRPLLASFPNSHALAKELIRRDWLTPYQVNHILQDKGDQLILGANRLRERLGEGAMGQVFKGWNLRLQRVVAVKTIHKELLANTKATERFRREIETAAQLDHPNIVLVRDADESGERPFLVMEYIDGPNLSSLVKAQGPLPVHDAVEYIRQAALGLQHAYERGVVHRDIKPHNLLLAPGEPPVVKILDFGLARFESERNLSTRLTQPGSTLGTIDYISPEQAQEAREADIRSDVYSLGCTLFFLLTAQPAFPGTHMAEKIGARLTGTAPSVRAVRPEVPEGLDRVMRRMMARLPADRYQTPAEVAAALQPFAMPREELEEATTLEGHPALPKLVPGAVPLALPVSAEDPAAVAALPVAASTDSPSAAKAHARHAPPTGGFDYRLLVALGAVAAVIVVLLLSVTAFVAYRYLRVEPLDEYPPPAALHITKARLSSDNLPEGKSKFIQVFVERSDFDGPVTVRLDRLPPDVKPGSAYVVIPPNRKEIEVPISASFGVKSVIADVRVIATAKNLRDEATVRVEVVADKKGKKK